MITRRRRGIGGPFPGARAWAGTGDCTCEREPEAALRAFRDWVGRLDPHVATVTLAGTAFRLGG